MLKQSLVKGMLMKRLLILAATVAAILLVAAPSFAPAFAQSSEPDATVTGVIEPAPLKPEGPSHTITEASTGDVYGLSSDSQGVDLSQYEGQKVTINGIFQTQGGQLSDFADPTDVLIYVTSVEVLDDNPVAEEVSVAGLLEARGLAADRADITHYITDEGTGKLWGLISDDPQGVLDPYNGQRVTVTGTDATDFTPGGAEIPAIIVTGVDPSGTLDGNPPNDVDEDPAIPARTESFQGYAADVGAAGMRIDSDQSGEPCTGSKGSLTAAFTADTEFLAQRDGENVPIIANEVGNGDLVEVSYTLGPNEAVPAICPSLPINVDSVTVLEDAAPGDSPIGPPNGSTSDQYGSTSDQYKDGDSVDSPPAGPSSSDNGSSAGVLSLLPDTGGLPLLTLGLGSLLLVGGGLLGYRFIRQR